MNIRDVLQKIENNAFTKTFQKLYGTSEEVLQHHSTSKPLQQEIPLAVMMSKRVLKGGMGESSAKKFNNICYNPM
jgi:hypothetical protein